MSDRGSGLDYRRDRRRRYPSSSEDDRKMKDRAERRRDSSARPRSRDRNGGGGRIRDDSRSDHDRRRKHHRSRSPRSDRKRSFNREPSPRSSRSPNRRRPGDDDDDRRYSRRRNYSASRSPPPKRRRRHDSRDDDVRRRSNYHSKAREPSNSPPPTRRRQHHHHHSPSLSPPPPPPPKRSTAPLPSQQSAFSAKQNPTPTSPPPETEKQKQKPNFAPTGKLAAETNTVANTSIVLKYNEPPDSRLPSPSSAPWRLYVFKGPETLDTINLFERSCWLFGRERSVVDVEVLHPSCSKQHAVLQFRFREGKEREEFGGKGKGGVGLYVIDLESANGTLLNGERVPERRYVGVRSGDVLRFGESTREYVLMLPPKDPPKG